MLIYLQSLLTCSITRYFHFSSPHIHIGACLPRSLKILVWEVFRQSCMRESYYCSSLEQYNMSCFSISALDFKLYPPEGSNPEGLINVTFKESF